MRTSRISRDTSRILVARRTQRTLRQTRSGANIATRNADSVTDGLKREDHAASDSELSSVPADSGSDGEARPLKKRKRGQDTPIIVKNESKEVSIATIDSPKRASKPKKARRAPAKKVTGTDGSVKIEPPANWEEIYALTREMRNENLAPVDTMGCESLAERTRTPRDQRFQTLIALMLSSQTKDTVNAVAMRGMQERMPGGFNLESVLALEPATLNGFINKVGFHNLKTKYIKQTAELLRDKWDSDIPDSIEGLVSLPGVGPKMAFLTMSAAWGRDLGIGVDVHVHRITNLWGWQKSSTPEQTRAALESWLPKDKWHDINNLLVGFGQTICLPVGRKCGECKLADRGLCPSAVVAKGVKREKSTNVKKEESRVKGEVPGSEAVVKREEVVDEIREIKAEDAEAMVADIEDIGKLASGRTPRKKI
ncbi:DNA glycosylase [Ophiobolus disseminans]|uniref:Endonuclease III homolog n=1 Tax=Ophiobolus disseminans TaxID=1469910 RepID=A0A6A6ZPG2_9PLEO|nr:DNA glycosylase [Ophiobolus disseminans]